MKRIGLVLFNFSLFLVMFFTQAAFAGQVQSTAGERIPVPVTVSVSRTQWTTVISICNPTANAIPLNNIELQFNYSAKMPTNGIWGKPWAAWRVISQVNGRVTLVGGTKYTPPLLSDPKCLTPMTVIFNSTSSSPLPQGPFVFKSEGAVPTNIGNISTTVPAAPAAGLNNPQITIQGDGQTFNKSVAWGTEWLLTQVPAGSYTVTSSTVTNGTDTYQAAPITVTVSANTTAKASLVYTPVVPTTGNLTVNLPAAPEVGAASPTITVIGGGKTFNQTVTWGTQWKLTGLSAGTYTVSSSTVTVGDHTYQANPVNVTVSANATAQATLAYSLVTPIVGNLTINMPASPEAGVANPQITVEGMGKTFNQTVAWGTQWKLSNLTPGGYKVSSSVVGNGTHNYQATPVNVTVTANETVEATPQFTLVAPTTGSLTVRLPGIPETGVANPLITVEGMGQTFNQTVVWGNAWQLNNLMAGSYTITSNSVGNGTNNYFANPVNVTVTAGANASATLSYTKVNPARPTSWNNIKHVVIIIFENTSLANTMKQPFFSSLVKKGAYLTQSFARTHPSQPNYFALTAATTFNIRDNDNHNIDAPHIADLLEAKGYTWKSYAEGYPGNCFQGSYSGTYGRKHEPFISYINVQSNPTRCAKIQKGTQFFTDLKANALPTYSFYVPDSNNSGHDTGVAYADKWLANTFGPIFNDPAVLKDTLFIITFDEDEGSSENKIYTAFIGAGVKVGAISGTTYNHYSIVRTLEDIFQLDRLGDNDLGARPVMDIWQP